MLVDTTESGQTAPKLQIPAIFQTIRHKDKHPVVQIAPWTPLYSRASRLSMPYLKNDLWKQALALRQSASRPAKDSTSVDCPACHAASYFQCRRYGHRSHSHALWKLSGWPWRQAQPSPGSFVLAGGSACSSTLMAPNNLGRKPAGHLVRPLYRASVSRSPPAR